MTEKLFFDSHLRNDGQYSILTVHVFLAEPGTYDMRNSRPEQQVTFSWQMTNKEHTDGWYAFTMQVETRDLEMFNRCTKVVRKIAGKNALSLYQTTPSELLDRLTALRAVECVYDGRMGEYVALDDVLPADYSSWRDDYTALGRSSCMADCLARNEMEAKALILKYFTDKIQNVWNPDTYAKLLTEYIAAGQPVIQLGAGITRSYGPPDVTPLSERIN